MKITFLASLFFVLFIILSSSFPSIELNTSNAVKSVFSKETSGFKSVIFYYGWLNTSNILRYDFDIIIISGYSEIFPGGNDYNIIKKLRKNYTEVYAYLHDKDKPIAIGSSFNAIVYKNYTGSINERVNYWINYIKTLIGKYAGVVDGIFLDESDPSYFGITDPTNAYLKLFNFGLKSIVNYAKSKGLKIIINGVRAYANLGDYYLWENFVAIYKNKKYTLDSGFFNTLSNNSYDWINGIAKYNYLKNNNLLNKTIALSFVNKTNLENALYAYYMSRLLGLAGWGLATIDIYSQGGPIITVNVYETGLPLDKPIIKDCKISRYFLTGYIEIDLCIPSLSIPFEYDFMNVNVDGFSNEYVLNTESIEGNHSTINSYSYLPTIKGLYIYVNISLKIPNHGGILHVYIDYDENLSTGYNYLNILGVDYLVEIQENKYAYIYKYNGSGQNWNWIELEQIDNVIIKKDNTYVIELLIPSFAFKTNSLIIIASIINWNDDAIFLYKIKKYFVVPPTIFDNLKNYEDYYGIIFKISLKSSIITILSKSKENKYVNYTLMIPFSKINVFKNNKILENFNLKKEGYSILKTNNYTKIIITVYHDFSIISLKIISDKDIFSLNNTLKSNFELEKFTNQEKTKIVSENVLILILVLIIILILIIKKYFFIKNSFKIKS